MRFPGKADISQKEYKTMRRKNWRVVIVGVVLTIIALGFYYFMQSIARSSTDPAALMQTVGTVTGVVAGISLVMIIIGLNGKKD
jgi:multidrug resistance efflux pump